MGIGDGTWQAVAEIQGGRWPRADAAADLGQAAGAMRRAGVRACLDGTLRSCLGYLPAWELPVLNCNIAWPGKNWNPGVVWLMA